MPELLFPELISESVTQVSQIVKCVKCVNCSQYVSIDDAYKKHTHYKSKFGIKHRLYYECKKCHRIYAKRHYLKHRDKRLLQSRIRWERDEIKYRAYKLNAEKRKYAFDLTFEEFKTFKNQNCFYCGKYIDYVAIDRKENDKGYVSGNCVSCCTWCNRMKLKASESEFLEHIKNIYLNRYKH